MGAKTVVVEDGLSRADVREELDLLSESIGSGCEAQATVLSFFSRRLTIDEISAVDANALIGQAVVIACGNASPRRLYVYEAILRTPATFDDATGFTDLLNNYIHSSAEYDLNVANRRFTVRGVYFCQQNATTSVCAHASLRMAVNSMQVSSRISTASINKELALTPPYPGLRLDQIHAVLAARGLVPIIYNVKGKDPVAPLYSVIESGSPALLVFSTGTPVDHVVTIFGHTLNSDEWHPRGIPAYQGPSSAKFYSSSSWADHFLIHDDNFGPYFCLASSSFLGSSAVKPKLVIGLLPADIKLAPMVAESIAAAFLQEALTQIGSGASQSAWWQLMATEDHKYVFRTTMMSRADYANHISSVADHRGIRAASAESQVLSGLPEQFWVCEYTLPDLYTGNKTKLGEVLVRSDQGPNVNNIFESVIALRAPGFVLLTDSGKLYPSALAAHVPLHRRRKNSHEW